MATLEFDSESKPGESWTAYAHHTEVTATGSSAMNAAMKLIDELENLAVDLTNQVDALTQEPEVEPAEATS